VSSAFVYAQVPMYCVVCESLSLVTSPLSLLSWHVNVNSILCGWYLRQSKNYLFFYFFIFLIIISTTLIKQHYLIDILGGFTWCIILYLLAKWVFKLGLKRNEAVGL
jgi:membrane-associated phospholipid phosphatase